MRTLLLSAVLALAAACPGRDVEVVQTDKETSDHGHGQLIALVEAHAGKPPAPAAYRSFILAVDALRPQFNDEMHDFAELYVTFFALPVLEAVVELPPAEQLDALALTVFPTAFGVEPAPGESAHAYLTRVCGEEQPLECRDFVPEGWPVLLSARARRLLKHRAEAALSACSTCPDKAVYTEMLESFRAQVARGDALARQLEDDYLPGKWPLAGDHAAPWSEAPLFALVDGDATLEGVALATGRWQRFLAGGRGEARVLGVHLEPDDRVETLRVIGRDASRAGYSSLALQVRGARFPYALGEYRLALAGRARRVDVRDIDTVQILARALDAARAGGRPEPRL